MTKYQRIDDLMADARLLEDAANSISAAALVYRAKNFTNEERSLCRMARAHRIQALLAYGQAAVLRGRVMSVHAPE